MIRTRFAPSPTGDLHLGNLRVAVFNHLFTRHHGGTFVLRVEDTDEERNVEGALETIMEDLRWAGLQWDEGPDVGGAYGPYRQSERGEGHREAALALVEAGKAYRCFCPEEEAPDPADPEAGPRGRPPAGCPGGCRGLEGTEALARVERGDRWIVRFPVPQEPIVVEDEIRGRVTVHGRDLADFVLLRSDGRATYNFAVVLDDVAMAITHVIRGAGHLSNTPKQALLFDALGAPRPRFAHLPMVLGADRRKLSKREGARGVRLLREEGFLPDAVVNYLSLLGWSPGDDREILTREELIRELSLDRVGASDTVFDEEKLRWVSGQHLATFSLEALVDAVEPYLDRGRFPLGGEALVRAVAAIRTRLQVLSDVNPALALLFPDAATLEAGLEDARSEGPHALPLVAAVREALARAPAWEAEALGKVIRDAGKAEGARGPALFHPFRLVLCGARSGPDLGLVLVALGREEALRRLDRAGGSSAASPV
jgi:nondiscriminating glutamyl-tRNA synthetase